MYVPLSLSIRLSRHVSYKLK